MSNIDAITPVQTIDVRVIAPSERHKTIFGTLEGLAFGECMEVTSDHEPAPLHSHLKQAYPGEFSFEYLERGPVVWRFRITRIVE